MDSRLVMIMLVLTCCFLAGASIAKANEPTGQTNGYFGVDANDAEAVAQKQKELAEENAKKLFGDVDLDEHLIFDIPDEKSIANKLSEVGERFKNVIQKLADLFPSTTEAPTNPNANTNQ